MAYTKVTDESLITVLESRGKRKYHPIQKELLEIMNDDTCKVVKIDLNRNYSSIASAQSSYIHAIKRLNIGAVACIYNGELYIVKTGI